MQKNKKNEQLFNNKLYFFIAAATGDGQSTTPERTCGIVCFQCDKLVTKSYSCYKKENAPEKIKHLFTPGVKVVKVCRRCMPYKKPKDSEDAAGTGKGKGKIIKGKLAKLHSAKLIKNAKSAGKVNAVKTTEKTKVASLEKNSIKLPTKDDKKRKESPKDEKLKLLPASKKLCSLAVQTKKAPVSKGTVTKETKAVPKGIRLPIREELKVEVAKLTSAKSANVSSKTLISSPKSGVQVQKNDGSVAEKAKTSAVEKENATVSKEKSVKVDFGTQSMKSMIGINKVKTRPTDSSPPNETVTKDENVVEKEFIGKESTEKEVDVVDISEKQETETEGALVESQLRENVSGTEKEKQTVVIDNVETSAKEKIDEEMNTKTADADSPGKDETSTVSEDNQSESKILNDDNKMESKNTEGHEVTKQDRAEAADSKNIADSIITRGRRSASRSPVIARETKSTEALSPRKGRSSGTPEAKREDKQIIPTIMTRKRLASFSEAESDKKVDNSPGGKRKALAAALLEKMSRKAGDSSSSSTMDVTSNKLKEEHPYAKDEKEPEKEGESKIVLDLCICHDLRNSEESVAQLNPLNNQK